MEKLERIRLIETPRAEYSLGRKEMNKIVGGEVCTSFDDCFWLYQDTCSGTYSEHRACDGSDGIKCGSYTPSIFDF